MRIVYSALTIVALLAVYSFWKVHRDYKAKEKLFVKIPIPLRSQITMIIGVIVFFITPGVNAQTVIDSDTTWTKGGSPYAVTKDLTIVGGTTLTIEPSVAVEVVAGCSIYIEGLLIARGTAEEKILFNGVLSGEERAQWGSLVFEDTSTDAQYQDLDDYLAGSIVEHCTFENASQAIQLKGASPFIHRCIFRNNLYEYEGEMTGGAAIMVIRESAPRIVECTFTDNTAESPGQGGAIFVDTASPIIQDNTFTNNRSGYGGALTTYNMLSPIVGNTFERNGGSWAWEGGGMAFVSSAQAFLNNLVTNNQAIMDGAGVHVCTTCYPHADPLLMDNTITYNTSSVEGGAGVGAAFIRIFSHNNIHDNLTAGEPADFVWFNKVEDGYPDWVQNPHIPNNWWGTTEKEAVDRTIHDGNDDPSYGVVTYEPILIEPVGAPETRVTITTLKIKYGIRDEPMPVFLSLYNPRPEREVRLVLLLQYGEVPPIIFQGDIDFPGVRTDDDGYHLTMPQNSVYFTTLIEPGYSESGGPQYGAWHAALFDAQTHERIGDVCSIGFHFGPGGH